MSDKQQSSSLYLCYFGLREPLVQTQVLPYLRQIFESGTKITLLTFESQPALNWTKEEIENEKSKLLAEGIEWHMLPYHKSPSVPATLYDVLCGALYTRKMIAKNDINIIHARVHMPMLMAALARKLSRRPVKILFDIRGFFPEEYTDVGHWKKDRLLYKTVKRVERWLLGQADGFVVLTEKARDILFPGSRETGNDKDGRPVEVIPCCVDLARFAVAGEKTRHEIRTQYHLQDRKVIVYIGALGTWYMLDEMADLFQAAREQDESVFAMVLTQSAPEMMVERLEARGFSGDDMIIKKVSPAEVPAYLSAADTALSFIKPCFSKLSSSPTKLAEYFAGGLPVITNDGVGDVAEQVTADKTGAVITEFSQAEYLRALQEIDALRADPKLAENCRNSAKNRFDLEKIGGEKYRSIYRRLVMKG
jgi:glycosyltransferase involved in cell wall biosynthesis